MSAEHTWTTSADDHDFVETEAFDTIWRSFVAWSEQFCARRARRANTEPPTYHQVCEEANLMAQGMMRVYVLAREPNHDSPFNSELVRRVLDSKR